MSTLIVVRHGQASFGGRNYDVLSPLGERQGVVLGEHWKRVGQQFDAVYTGTLERQKLTAQRTLEGMGLDGTPPPATVDPAYDEYDHKNLIRSYLPIIARENPEFAIDRTELLSDRRRFQRVMERITTLWLEGVPGELPLDETWEQFRTRTEAGIRRIADSGAERSVLFTSGGVIGVAMRKALNVTDDMAIKLNWRVYNASVHMFWLGKRSDALLRFNDISHLELAGDENLITYR
ncbi:MAG: histidine phosphatase family protein [Nevskia sp.]|nr:histidine phosphatase family protein [Nevskia sp.]